MRKPAIAKLAVLLCLLLCASAARADGSKTVGGKPENLLPFVPQHGFSGIPLVQVKINGTVDATFVLDTGTTLNGISSSLVKQLDLRPYVDTKIATNGTPFTLVTPRFDLNRFSFPDYPATILNDDQLPSELKQKASGIIGMNLLKLFALVFDFQSNTILMIGDGNLTADELKEQGFESATVLPLSGDMGNVQYVTVTVKNRMRQGTERLIVDTGSDGEQISYSLAQTLHLPVLKEVSGWQYLTGAYKKFFSQATLVLGDVTLPDLDVAFPNSDKVKVTSTLGVDVLSRYRVLIDFPANKMYFAPSVPAVVQVKSQK